MNNKLTIEKRLGTWLRAFLPEFLTDFVMFGAKMAWACVFAGALLAAIIITKLVYPDNAWLTRYDFLVLFAVTVQILMLTMKLETWAEVKVIFLFHVSGTAMEVFKLAQGSWDYPETGVFEIMGVPLFSGFMYAAVGSFMARAIRSFDMKFTPFPNKPLAFALAIAIYLNFFTHHYIPDLRWPLIIGTFIVFGRVMNSFTPFERTYYMPMVISGILSSLFLYLAENIGTLTATWTYAGSDGFALTNPAKITSWYLLLWLSFMQVILVHPNATKSKRLDAEENLG